MAKESGIGMGLLVDDATSAAQDIGADVTALSWATPRAVQDVTGLDKSAMERMFLLADMSVEMTALFNDAANRSHDVFKTVPSTAVPRTVTIQISGQELEGVLLLTDYALERSESGELVATVPGVLADGAVPTWGVV